MRLLALTLLLATTATAGERQFVDVTPTFVPPSMSGVKAFIMHGRPDAVAHGSSRPTLPVIANHRASRFACP